MRMGVVMRKRKVVIEVHRSYLRHMGPLHKVLDDVSCLLRMSLDIIRSKDIHSSQTCS